MMNRPIIGILDEIGTDISLWAQFPGCDFSNKAHVKKACNSNRRGGVPPPALCILHFLFI